jgi:hypothetical protein
MLAVHQAYYFHFPFIFSRPMVWFAPLEGLTTGSVNQSGDSLLIAGENLNIVSEVSN